MRVKRRTGKAHPEIYGKYARRRVGQGYTTTVAQG